MSALAPLSDPIVGIDLGTTNSLVAYADPSRGLSPRILKDSEGRSLVPSIVRYGQDGRPEAVGYDARTGASGAPRLTIASAKRLMGRSLTDAEADEPYLSYEVVEGPNRTARIRLPLETGDKVISPQEVSAAILSRLRDQASAALGVPVRRAVVTVPAYFDDSQRQATRDAGRLAGLEVLRIVNEPTAAALAYGIGVTRRTPETIAVFDLGGGTFDISILSLIPQEGHGEESLGSDFFQVLATAGDTHLGGDDVDQMLVRLMIDELVSMPGMTYEFEAGQIQRLRAAAEGLKIRLSTDDAAEIDLEIGAVRYRRTLTRNEFDGCITGWVERTIECCRRVMRDAKLSSDAISRVVMVGGSTRIPFVRQRVKELFGTEPYTALDPDEVVALGAAVQASILAGLKTDALLLDVIPLSLGIETVGGAVAKLILRNTQVPARATEMFSTSVDGQTSIKLQILQGEREMVTDCRSLGVFHLRGIPPMPAGIPQVQVEFLIDANGVLNVSAVERRSSTRASLQIVPNHGLTRDEVDRIEAESFAHAREDMTHHRIVDLIANSKLDLKWIGDRISKLGDKVPASYREELESRMAALCVMIESAEKDWTSVDPQHFQQAKETMDHASIRLHEMSMTDTLRSE